MTKAQKEILLALSKILCLILILFIFIFSGCASKQVNPDLEMLLYFYQQHNVQKHKLFEMEAFPGEMIMLKGVSRITVWAPPTDFQFDKFRNAIPQRKTWWETTVSGLVTVAQYAAPVVGYLLGLQIQGDSIADAIGLSNNNQQTWAGDFTIWRDSPYTVENNPITTTTEISPTEISP